MTDTKKINFLYILAQGLCWMGFCAAVTNAVVYLQEVGYSNAELGLVVAAGNLLSFLVSNELGKLVDRLETFTPGKAIFLSLMAELFAAVLLCLLRSKSILVSILYVIYIMAASNISATLPKVWADFCHIGKTINFGAARAVGSACFVLASVVIGKLVSSISANVIQYISIGIVLLQILINHALSRMFGDEKITRKNAEKTGWIDFYLQNKNFCLLMFGLFLLFFSYGSYNNFTINVVRNLGGNEADMGYLNGFMALMEIFPMLFYNRLRKNRGCTVFLVMAVCFFTVKIYAVVLAQKMMGLYLAYILQLVSFAIYTPAIVDYVSEVIPFENSAFGQSLAYGMSTIGNVFASLICGEMYDRYSVKTTLLVASIVSVIGTALCLISLFRGRAQKQRIMTD